MRYFAPYGVSDPDAPYVNGNPSTGTMGSIPPAQSIEHPQRELVELIKDSGLNPDENDLKQLARGVQLGRLNFAIDGGTVNNLQVTLAPVPDYLNGLVIRILPAQNNTGPAVLNVNAKGPKKIRRPGDTDLLANDLTARSISTLVYNETLQSGQGAFELQGVASGATGTGTGGYMTKNMDLYVNYAIGNDANDGTANDAGHAVKQIQRAVDIAWGYRPSQYTLTIHVADSQFYGPVATPFWAGPNLSVIGNVAAPAGVLVTGIAAGANSKNAFVVAGNNIVTVSGIKVTMPVVDANHQGVGFYASGGASLALSNTETGFCDGYHILAGYNGIISTNLSHRISGSTYGQILCASGMGQLTSYQTNFAIAQAISCGYFAHASMGYIQINAAMSPITGGPVTGQRYFSEYNGVVSVLGGGVNYFPGTIAGTLAYGGQYAP